MIEITGKYGTAKIYTDNVDEETLKQLYKMLNSIVSENANLRIMPDCHVVVQEEIVEIDSEREGK